MKKFLLVLFLLPLVSFGAFEFQGWNVERMRIFKYTAFGVTDLPTRAITIYPSSVDDLSSSLSSSTFGFCVTLSPSTSQKMIAPIPTSARFFVFDSIASDTTITNSLYFTSPSNCVVSAHYIPSVSAIYYSASLLYLNGYRGSGIVNDFSSGQVHCVNVNYPTLVADIVSSTNTVYRQILFSYLAQLNNSLSSIQTSVNNVNVDLGQFQSDYSFVNASHFDISNVIDSAVSDSVIPSRLATSLKSLARYPFNHDNINSVLDTYRSSQWLPLAFSDSDLASPLHNDARVKQGLRNLGDSFGAGASLHYTTPLTNELQKLNSNWVSEAKAALSNNTFQITNQLAHMFDDIPNSLGRAIRDTANNTLSTAIAAGSIDQRLANGLTVSVVNSGASSVLVSLDGPINIDQTQFNSLSVPLGSLQRSVSDWYSDWYSFFSVSSPVYKWENFYNMVSAFKDQNHIDLSAVTNSLSSISSLSNLLAAIDEHLTNSLPNLTNFFIASSSFSALLLDHYEDYISNSVYASSISKLETDFPSVYSNLVDFGLSPSGDGDFWSLFGSSLIQLDLLADNFISDMALVRKFADDNIQGGFSAGISSIIEVMPKKEDIVSSASAASNIVSALDLSSTNLVSAFHSVTSRADSVFTPFRGTFETPPSDLVLFKTGNDKYITIPVHEHPEAFRLMRWGFSFALAAVNFIFFPKFVLMLVMLFSKLSQRFVKFYPSVKDE